VNGGFHALAMAVGAGGALLPLMARLQPTFREATAHIACAVAMVSMVPTGDLGVWLCLLGGAVMVVLALWLTSDPRPVGTGMLCSLDLAAMGLMMLFVLPNHMTANVHTAATATGFTPLGQHHHTDGTVALSTWLGPAVLIGWAGTAFALVLRRRSETLQACDARSAWSTGLMVTAMVPMAAFSAV